MVRDCNELYESGRETAADEAAEAERAAVVKWLRDRSNGRLQSPIFLADAIEAGEHLSGDRER